MPGRLQDKVIVIIGGTAGIGESASRACLNEGAHVVAVGRDGGSCERLQNSAGANCVAIARDARIPTSADEAVNLAVKTFGKLDGLYHVAGGSGRRYGDGPLHEISDDGWQQTLNWNLSSVFYSHRAAARQFLLQKTAGSILSVGSVLASHPSPRFFATHAYATAKAAIVGLTVASAAYYAPSGIRFNVLMPALVETPMAQRAASDAEIMNYISHKQPLDGGRIGQPHDLDSAVVYFLSDESKFVTGQCLAIDGGWSVTE